VSIRCTIEDKSEPMAEYQALAPATRQLANTTTSSVSLWVCSGNAQVKVSPGSKGHARGDQPHPDDRHACRPVTFVGIYRLEGASAAPGGGDSHPPPG
jgi:hypothetical protein